jgi:class 3 adenylate cyclase
MRLEEELRTEARTIFQAAWTTHDGHTVPESEDVQLGNDAIKLSATVLYADLRDSTQLVDDKKTEFAAEVYKTFLHCAAKLIKNAGGVITAYDGDRIMGVYLGTAKNTSAAATALKINYAVQKIINPALSAQYMKSSYEIRHRVGIDTSDLFVARTGVRGSNDLVWVGRAANYAAKLAALPGEHASYITSDVYRVLNKSAKLANGTGADMWSSLTWDEFDGQTIYSSGWRRPVDD